MDIIQVLIFIVIIVVAIVQQISKAGKEKKTPSPKEVLADMFPEIEQENISASTFFGEGVFFSLPVLEICCTMAATMIIINMIT